MSTNIRDELERSGTSLARARTRAEEKLKEAQDLAIKGDAEGVPEAEIARLLQVDRMTVRKWLGKR